MTRKYSATIIKIVNFSHKNSRKIKKLCPRFGTCEPKGFHTPFLCRDLPGIKYARKTFPGYFFIFVNFCKYSLFFLDLFFKWLHGFWNFEKSVFFIILYIIVQNVTNIFPKFQVNRNKILGERNFWNPPPPPFGALSVAFRFESVFLKTVFLKSVDTISQKLLHRSF